MVDDTLSWVVSINESDATIDSGEAMGRSKNASAIDNGIPLLPLLLLTTHFVLDSGWFSCNHFMYSSSGKSYPSLNLCS